MFKRKHEETCETEESTRSVKFITEHKHSLDSDEEDITVEEERRNIMHTEDIEGEEDGDGGIEGEMVTVKEIIDASNDALQSVNLAQRLGLIRSNDDGPLCGTRFCNQPPMRLNQNSTVIDGFRWRCHGMIREPRQRKKRCTYTRSLRTYTFLARSKLPIWKILMFTRQWCRKNKIVDIVDVADIRRNTGTHWASYCREVVFDAMILNRQPLGGPGRTVEINESKFGRREYHQGHRVEGTWVFGGIERETGNVFMVTVAQRSSAYLVPIIKHWILPGTTIISDCWRAYNCLQHEGFRHLSVNHSITFKDPVTGAHTNAIESSWRHAKESLSSNGRKSAFLAGNLACYMFWKSCKIQNVDTLLAFCNMAGTIYNGIHDNANRLTPRLADYYRLIEELGEVENEVFEDEEAEEFEFDGSDEEGQSEGSDFEL